VTFFPINYGTSGDIKRAKKWVEPSTASAPSSQDDFFVYKLGVDADGPKGWQEVTRWTGPVRTPATKRCLWEEIG
jgi:hypothetical protein